MKNWLPALLLLLAVGCDTTAQVKPPPQFLRWIIVPPPPVGGITYVFTAPILSNAGTCDSPIFRPATSIMTIKWKWTGPDSGSSSLFAMPGDTCRIQVPASAESLRVWGERSGIAGCDTTVRVN